MNNIDAQLKAFCEGYLYALLANGDLVDYADDWVVWDGFDINLTGREYSEQAGAGLRVNAYPAGWKDSLPHPLYQFTVGEMK